MAIAGRRRHTVSPAGLRGSHSGSAHPHQHPSEAGLRTFLKNTTLLNKIITSVDVSHHCSPAGSPTVCMCVCVLFLQLRLMSQCSGSIEDIKRVSLMLDDEEQAEELGLTGLTASDKQSGDRRFYHCVINSLLFTVMDRTRQTEREAINAQRAPYVGQQIYLNP